MRVVTIGGYGFTEQSFFEALKRAGVDLFLDVRRRRGMRGAKYAFLNSSRLQQRLAEAGVRYVHALELAPTAEVREAQKQADASTGTGKRIRVELAPEFIAAYETDILSKVDMRSLRETIGTASMVALFCVEGSPSACHRSLAANHLARWFGSELPVKDLRL